MKKFLSTLGTLTVVLGLIGSFVMAKEFGVTGVDRNWLTTITIFLGGMFSTAVLSSILFGISEILQTMEYQNNSIIDIQKRVRKLEDKTNSISEKDK